MKTYYTSHRPVLMGTHWMVTADHPLAARAGAEVLAAGGNAVDAAVAANLVLTVVRPHMCGIGGDLFALIYMKDRNELHALNASGRAPAGASVDLFKQRGYETIPPTDILAATVPGAISGWQSMLEKFGTRGLDTLLATAVDYAENGFPVYADLRLAMVERKPFLMRSESAAPTFFKDQKTPAIGDLLFQRHLARSYRKLAEQGPSAFYGGELGRALVEYSRASGGLFSEGDLDQHTCNWVEPLTTDYRGYQICTLPPNSQGIALLMQANINENFSIADFNPQQAELVHRMVEAKKLAFADRDRYVCDPQFNPVPIKQMLDKSRAGKLAGGIRPGTAATNVQPGEFSAGGSDTVYLAVVDGQGNAVSLIQSLYEEFGSCVMVPETGIVLHNRGLGFTLDPGHPNCLEPGKRPYHTLHPAMLLKDGSPYIVLGTPGADGQTQSVMQLITALIDFGADPQQAMEAPRWRSEPDGTLLMESRFPPETISQLKSKGHAVEPVQNWDEVMGSAQAILIDRSRSILMAGADPRREAYAIGK